jgi:hypothetical protein
MSWVDMKTKTIALLQAVRQITEYGSIQLADINGRSFLNHTHLPTDELTRSGMFAKCYIRVFDYEGLAVQLKEFTWINIAHTCRLENLNESEKVEAVRHILHITGSLVQATIESQNSIGVLKLMIQEWLNLQIEDGLQHIHISPAEMLLASSSELSAYQEFFRMIFSETIPDPSLM